MKKGFTLAEVLITLGIIGIVAAITIPILMNNIQDQQFKTAWKKQFSQFSNATNLVLNDNGGTIASLCINVDGTTNDYSCFRDLFIEQFKITKKCDRATSDGCVASPRWSEYHDVGNVPDNKPAFITTDGASYTFSGYTLSFLYVFVDVNGTAPPNTQGKDSFLMFLYRDPPKVHAVSQQDDTEPCHIRHVSNAYYDGLGCSEQYLLE